MVDDSTWPKMPQPEGLPISVMRPVKPLHPGRDQRRGPAQDLDALADGPRGPIGGVEGGPGGGHGEVDIGVGGLGDPAGHLLGERVDHVDGAGAGRSDELAADVETIVDDHRETP